MASNELCKLISNVNEGSECVYKVENCQGDPMEIRLDQDGVTFISEVPILGHGIGQSTASRITDIETIHDITLGLAAWLNVKGR